jgi:hypothetical protein
MCEVISSRPPARAFNCDCSWHADLHPREPVMSVSIAQRAWGLPRRFPTDLGEQLAGRSTSCSSPALCPSDSFAKWCSRMAWRQTMRTEFRPRLRQSLGWGLSTVASLYVMG